MAIAKKGSPEKIAVVKSGMTEKEAENLIASLRCSSPEVASSTDKPEKKTKKNA